MIYILIFADVQTFRSLKVQAIGIASREQICAEQRYEHMHQENGSQANLDGCLDHLHGMGYPKLERELLLRIFNVSSLHVNLVSL